MKIDVVACYYKQIAYTPTFFFGVGLNKEHINSIIVVNDDLWSKDESREVLEAGKKAGVETILLGHEHDGYGVARSLNQGITQATTDYCFTMSYDQVLGFDCLAKITELAHPGRLIVGAVHGIPEGEPLPPKEVKEDYILKHIGTYLHLNRPWLFARNGHTLIPRKAHEQIGGFNEEFCKVGYGLEDYEYGAWWVADRGMDSIVFGPSYTWHFEDFNSRENKFKQYKPEGWELLLKPVQQVLGHRYLLFNQAAMKSSHINVSHDVNQYAFDVKLDCLDLDWMEDGSAEEILVKMPNGFVSQEALPAYLERLEAKVKPGGNIEAIE